MGESGLKRYLLKSIVPAGIAGAILLRSAQAERVGGGAALLARPHPAGFHSPSGRRRGGRVVPRL